MPEHGGQLNLYARRYDRPVSDWLDLSTGINPNGWPVPELPVHVWSRLPETDDGLLAAAQQYYQTQSLIAVPGTQAAIQLLPTLRARSRIGILQPSYNEHAYCWQQAGHEVIALSITEIEQQIDTLDVLLIVNPNNPTGDYFQPQDLLGWHQQLQQRSGWLIVDEAFMDATPHLSLTTSAPQSGLILLRSLGKFFGLAGLRVGFVLAETAILQTLTHALGPWPVATASRYISCQALSDKDWQQQNRIYLSQAAKRLAGLLHQHSLPPTGGTPLFQWVKHKQAAIFHHQLAQYGILTRLFNAPDSLRFGLPASETDWLRLEQGLTTLKARFDG